MTNKTIQFLDTTYTNVTFGVETNHVSLETMSSANLVKFHNLVADNINYKTVKRFSDHATAVKRTWAMLENYETEMADEEGQPSPPLPKEKLAKAAPKAKSKVFNFKPLPKDERQDIRGTTSLRAQAVTLLKSGATFSGVEDLVRKFDADRGKGNAEAIERRAYDLVRILHYIVGYGIKTDAEGIITIYL